MHRLLACAGSWLKHYDACKFARVDPNAWHCKTRLDPVLAGPDSVKPCSDRLLRQWVDDSRGLGVRGTIVFPLRSQALASYGGFSCSTRLGRKEARSWAADAMPHLLIAMQCADTRLLQLARKDKAEAIRLSPREREVLLWLAKGLRNDRIAERMRISNPTVELHLANAAHRPSLALAISHARAFQIAGKSSPVKTPASVMPRPA